MIPEILSSGVTGDPALPLTGSVTADELSKFTAPSTMLHRSRAFRKLSLPSTEVGPALKLQVQKGGIPDHRDKEQREPGSNPKTTHNLLRCSFLRELVEAP